jgi:FixJ family two-component response regulator
MIDINYVFVVDVDPSARQGLVRLLSAAGQNVRNYASITDFLAALEPGICGCLVLDAEVPGKSGLELLEEIKTRNADLSIIMISAKDDRVTKRRCWEMQAVGFFRKPVDGTALIDAVDWALRAKNNRGNNTNAKSK